MSLLSEKLLKSHHKGVHQQFDALLVATTLFQAVSANRSEMEGTLRTNQAKILKKEIKRQLKKMGHNSWFVLPGVAYYAFEIWEVIAKEQLGGSPSQEELIELQDDTLRGCADYLDAQFEKEGRADVIGFLKGKPI